VRAEALHAYRTFLLNSSIESSLKDFSQWGVGDFFSPCVKKKNVLNRLQPPVEIGREK
jgi:hypothetical protein